MTNFAERLESLTKQVVTDAITSINNHRGHLYVRLATGEDAIDNYDAWIILQNIRSKSPLCRDKREQRMREIEGPSHKVLWEDYALTDKWNAKEICNYADFLSRLW